MAAACAAIGLFAAGGDSAFAQSKTLKIIVPYTPGSGPDILSRLLGEQIGKAGGPTVVVENRPGGGTTIGTDAASRAEPDGNTLLLVANSFVVNTALKRSNFSLASFEPVCNLAATPMPLVVQSSSPWKTVKELVAYAKANPGKFTFASGGPATSLHVAIEVLQLATKIDVNYVPYGGTAPAINALMGGHVQAVWADYPTVVSHLKSGTLRALVSPRRNAPMPCPACRPWRRPASPNTRPIFFTAWWRRPRRRQTRSSICPMSSCRDQGAGDAAQVRPAGSV